MTEKIIGMIMTVIMSVNMMNVNVEDIIIPSESYAFVTVEFGNAAAYDLIDWWDNNRENNLWTTDTIYVMITPDELAEIMEDDYPIVSTQRAEKEVYDYIFEDLDETYEGLEFDVEIEFYTESELESEINELRNEFSEDEEETIIYEEEEA